MIGERQRLAALRLRAAMIDAGRYVDEVNRERDRYLAGLISLDEFERRVEAVLRDR